MLFFFLSSVSTSDPEDLPRSAFDGNPATTWIAGPVDAHPMLKIRWAHRVKVSQVTIQRPPGAGGRRRGLWEGGRGGRGGGTGARRRGPPAPPVFFFFFPSDRDQRADIQVHPAGGAGSD